MERTAYAPDSTLKADAAKLPVAVSTVTRLLLCGIISGLAFVLAVLIQDYTRPGVDPRLQPLSELSLGDWGWVQILNPIMAAAPSQQSVHGIVHGVGGLFTFLMRLRLLACLCTCFSNGTSHGGPRIAS